VSLAVCHHATCDAPGCGVSFTSLHQAREAVRAQLQAEGWLLFSWRVPKRDPALGVDLGGAVRIYYVCPAHNRWRPRRGVECPLRKIAAPRPEMRRGITARSRPH
jgi:hypothetical protein